jgi:molecular chaperone DnaJ
MEDIFAQFGDIFGGAGFGGFGSATGGRGAQRRQRRGSDLRIRVKMTLEEIATGISKTLKIPTYVECEHCKGTGAKDGTAMSTCNRCHGTGSITTVQQSFFGAMQSVTTCPDCEGSGKVITEKCPHCNGEGVERKEQQIRFNIPAGVSDGMVLTVRGRGNAPRRGGVNGDLLVVIDEVKHPELIRDGADIIYNLMLDIPTATLGGSVEVPTLTGRARVNIAAGTQPGKILRLRGKGLPTPENKSVRGDQLINVMVYIPEKLNDAERKAIESLKEQPNTAPTEDDKNRIFSKLRHIFD